MILSHQKLEVSSFLRKHVLGHEDGKPADIVLKDCKRQRAEARAGSPVLLLEQLLD